MTFHETTQTEAPPMTLDKFTQAMGISPTTVWRYRRSGWLSTINICGKHYVSRAAIAEFNLRAARGDFAKPPKNPRGEAVSLN